MSSNIDVFIVAIYLVAALVVGVLKGRNIKSMKDYAVANRKYPTAVLIATISATLLGGGSTLGMAGEVFSHGIIFVVIFCCDAINKLIISFYVAPNFSRYTKHISVGDIIEESYGREAKIVTGLAGTFLMIGLIGAQISAIGYLFKTFFGLDYIYGVLIGCGVVITYSAFGGIKAVTTTDVLQFAVLIIAVPMICNVGLESLGGYKELLARVPKKHLELNLDVLSNYWGIIIIFCIPFLNPPVVQRLLMARDVKQIQRSFNIAAVIDLVFYPIVGIIGLIALAMAPSIDPSIAFLYVVNNLIPVGMKGLAIAGVMAVIMSTADSYLNAASISLVHDVLKPLKLHKMMNLSELVLTKIMTIIIGGLSVIISIYLTNIFDIILGFLNFWGPVIVMPLYFAIFDLKASKTSFFSGVIAGLFVVLSFKIFSLEGVVGFSSLIPAMAFNALAFLFSYQFFDKKHILIKGGHLIISRVFGLSFLKRGFLGLVKIFFRFSFSTIYNYSNRKVSIHGAQFIAFGIFGIINYTLPVFMWSNDDSQTFLAIRFISATLCFLLIMSDYWPYKLKKFLPVYWHFTLLFCLPFYTSLLMLENNFSMSWLINMSLGIFLLAMLTDWLSFAALLAIGIVAATLIFSTNNEVLIVYNLSEQNGFWLIYTFVFSVLIGTVFSRNREFIQRQVVFLLEKKVDQRTHHLVKALNVKREFLNNMSHEIRIPLQGVLGISEGLIGSWHNLKDKEKLEYTKQIASSGDRLMLMFSELLDFSALQDKKMSFDMKKNDLLKIINSVIGEFKGSNIVIDVDKGTSKVAVCDKKSITQVIRSLINNAVKFSDNKEINIILSQISGDTSVSVRDRGVGIPDREKEKIFEPFEESSRTKTGAGGKGLGLAICREIINNHGGNIKASNNEDKGAKFTFVLPLSNEGNTNPVN